MVFQKNPLGRRRHEDIYNAVKSTTVEGKGEDPYFYAGSSSPLPVIFMEYIVEIPGSSMVIP